MKLNNPGKCIIFSFSIDLCFVDSELAWGRGVVSH